MPADPFAGLQDESPEAETVLPRPGGLARLKPDPRNARKHSPRNVGMIQDSIQKNGFGRSLLVANDGTILAGNATYDALAAAGIEDVIEVVSDGTKAIVVRRTDLAPDDPEAVALAIADNRAADLATWDEVVLQQISIDFPGAIDASFRPEELDALLGPSAASKATREPTQVPLPDTPRSKDGCVWRLGEHLLVCGDSTKPYVWQIHDRYLQDSDYRLLCSDPPYNFDVVSGVQDYRDPNHEAGGRELKRIKNDKMPDDQYAQMLNDVWKEVDARLVPGAGVYLFGPSGGKQAITFQAAMFGWWPIRQTIVWVKQHFVFGPADYHWKHEMIYYGWKGGAKHLPVADRSQTTVWEVSRPTQTDDMAHPTQKPVELISLIVANGSQAGERVIDPFAGAGSTLHACEQLGRRCTAAEIDPVFCDLIVRGWEEISGGTAELLEPGWDIPEEDLG